MNEPIDMVRERSLSYILLEVLAGHGKKFDYFQGSAKRVGAFQETYWRDYETEVKRIRLNMTISHPLKTAEWAVDKWQKFKLEQSKSRRWLNPFYSGWPLRSWDYRRFAMTLNLLNNIKLRTLHVTHISRRNC